MEGHAQPLGRTLAPASPLEKALATARARAWTLSALTAFALVLRLTSLGRSLFNDETFSLALAQRGFGHMISLAGYEANGMAYSILLWPVTRIFGLIMIVSFRWNETHRCAPAPINALSGIKGPTGTYS